MATTVGYTTDDEYSAYAISRGYVLTGNSIVHLQLALDWLELQPFKGEKTDPLQVLEWPRDGNTEIPDKIVQAQLEAALVYNAGGNLMASIGKMVSEKLSARSQLNGQRTGRKLSHILSCQCCCGDMSVMAMVQRSLM